MDWRPWVATLCGLGALACVILGAQRWQAGDGALAARLLDVKSGPESPPAFELQTYEGPQFALSGVGDKTLVINFWATWCPPCIEEMPSLTRFVERFEDDPNFEFVAVSADDGWDPVRDFWPEGPPFRVALDPKGKMAAQWGTVKFPETYLVRNGRVLGHIVGPRDWDSWYAEAYMQDVLRR